MGVTRRHVNRIPKQLSSGSYGIATVGAQLYVWRIFAPLQANRYRRRLEDGMLESVFGFIASTLDNIARFVAVGKKATY